MIQLLLSLLPPSCMVVPIREVVNKQFSLSSAITLNSIISQEPSYIDIDINNSIIRGRSTLFSKDGLRSSLISSSTSSISYHQHIEINNNLPDIESQELIDSSQMKGT